MKGFSFDIIAVGNEIIGDVKCIGILCALWWVEKIAADKGRVMIVGVGFTFFIGAVKRCVNVSSGCFLIEIDGSFLRPAGTDISLILDIATTRSSVHLF